MNVVEGKKGKRGQATFSKGVKSGPALSLRVRKFHETEIKDSMFCQDYLEIIHPDSLDNHQVR
jgi:hypothetical protein